MNAGQVDHLVKMANQIALNMGAWGDEEAVARKTAEHLEKFWTPDMRELLRTCRTGNGGELSPVAARAMALLEG